MQAIDAQDMTYAEYLAFEEASEEKHEYVNGRAYAMAGGSIEHARLASAISAALAVALGRAPCVPFSSDLRVRNDATGRSTYPDVTVVCGKIERAADDDQAVTNPSVIVEVLSDSTEKSDRGEKWSHYQRIASLREYVLVSQSPPKIEVFSRDPERRDVWQYQEYGPGTEARLPSLGVTLAVDEIYANKLE